MALAPRQLTRDEELFLTGLEPEVDPEEIGLHGLFHVGPGAALIQHVHAWLESHHVDDYFSDESTLLLFVTDGHSFTHQVTTEDLVRLARDLLARGASPRVQSTGHYDYTVLMNACQAFPPDAVSSLLLDDAIPPFAKADPNVKASYDGSTALSIVLRSGRSFRDKLTLVKALLRAGASLDACYDQQSAEELLREQADDEDSDYVKLNSLIAGVRAEGGSYEIYAKKDTLVLRELVVREKATIADLGVKKFFKILAECPDDVTKHILTYCRW